MTDTCEHCGLERQPAHFGDPRKCAFTEETFSGNNWNCGLISPIRQAFSDGDGRESLHYRNDEVSTYGALVVAVPEYDEFWGHGYGLSGLLVGSWYKERGRVDDLKWAFRAHGGSESDTLTRTEALQIAAWLWAREEAEDSPAERPTPPAVPVIFASSSGIQGPGARWIQRMWSPAPEPLLAYKNPLMTSPSPAPGKKPKRRFPIPR